MTLGDDEVTAVAAACAFGIRFCPRVHQLVLWQTENAIIIVRRKPQVVDTQVWHDSNFVTTDEEACIAYGAAQTGTIKIPSKLVGSLLLSFLHGLLRHP